MALKIAAFVLPLGLDTFAVAVALGLAGVPALRPALLFAVFEAAMPIAGIAAGDYVGRRFEAAAVYAGGIVLIVIGAKILRETAAGKEERLPGSLRSFPGMVAAGFAISTDELAAGFPIGAARLPVGTVLAAIGLQALLVTAGGIWLGRRIGAGTGRWASRAAAFAAGAAFVLLGCYLIGERLLL